MRPAFGYHYCYYIIETVQFHSKSIGEASRIENGGHASSCVGYTSFHLQAGRLLMLPAVVALLDSPKFLLGERDIDGAVLDSED